MGRADDEGALREIMEAHFDDIAALALQYVRSMDLARDVAQETFIRFWDHRHRLAAEAAKAACDAQRFRTAKIECLRNAEDDYRATGTSPGGGKNGAGGPAGGRSASQ